MLWVLARHDPSTDYKPRGETPPDALAATLAVDVGVDVERGKVVDWCANNVLEQPLALSDAANRGAI